MPASTSRSDVRHCGDCNRACPAERHLQPGHLRLRRSHVRQHLLPGRAGLLGGKCCPAGQTNCGGTCRNLGNDGSNCGMCGRACGPCQRCAGGACAPDPCPERRRLRRCRRQQRLPERGLRGHLRHRHVRRRLLPGRPGLLGRQVLPRWPDQLRGHLPQPRQRRRQLWCLRDGLLDRQDLPGRGLRLPGREPGDLRPDLLPGAEHLRPEQHLPAAAVCSELREQGVRGGQRLWQPVPDGDLPGREDLPGGDVPVPGEQRACGDTCCPMNNTCGPNNTCVPPAPPPMPMPPAPMPMPPAPVPMPPAPMPMPPAPMPTQPAPMSPVPKM